jgi:Glycine rich protein
MERHLIWGRTSRFCAALGAASCLALLVFAGTARADFVAFGPTGAEQQFIVPAGVTSIRVIAVGAEGGGSTSSAGGAGGVGGSGATAAADLPVTPGEVLYVEVGTNGTRSTANAPGLGGFNGGADGGAGTGTTEFGGSGGGGATDLRTLPRTTTGSLTTRLIIAGGGGGGGGGTSDCPTCDFDAEGGAAEAAGVEGAGPVGGGATPTQGGTATAPAQPGTLGVGGMGGNSGELGATGGGGGAYGGGGAGTHGGGGFGGGGGGGSSAFAPEAINRSTSIVPTEASGMTILFTPVPSTPGAATPSTSSPPHTPVSTGPSPTPVVSALPSTLPVLAGRHFVLTFKATPGVTGKVSLLSAKKFSLAGKTRKKVLFASKNFTAPASGKVKLDLTLSQAAFSLLQSQGQIKVSANVVLNGATGPRSAATKSLTLIAPKPAAN